MSDKLYVSTPIGTLEAYASTDPEHPGIYIDIEGIPVALVEFDMADPMLRTLAWNNEEEDYVSQTPWGEWLERPFTDEEEKALQEWEEACELIPYPGNEGADSPYCYLWDGDWRAPDFLAMKERLNLPNYAPDKLFVYTVIEEDGEAYIDEGWHFVNRMGYFFSKKYVHLESPIRYW